MGINIGLVLSNHITKERWQSVYEEALSLAQKLGLADLTEESIHGHTVKCLTITKESEHYNRIGWRAVTDYEDRDGAEWFTMYRDMPEFGDTPYHDILAEYSYYIINLPGMEEPRGTFQEMWGAKTQGKSYHSSLLAVGCLVQDRLGDDAMVRGDYTAGQCRVAVEMANQYLSQPIQIPCQCDPERWMNRIGLMDVIEDYRIRIAIGMYYGRLDADFGERLRAVFSHDALYEYWRSRFANYTLSQVGFSNILHDYLTMGFDVGELCDLVVLEVNGGSTDKDNNSKDRSDDTATDKSGVERFIKHIMDAKLHWKEVDTTDIMVQDPEDPTLYGIEAMMVRGLSMGARNKKIDRYIPIEDLRKILREKLPGDVDGFIDAYLIREKELENEDTIEGRLERDRSAEVNRVMNERKEAIEELQKQFPIYEEELLVEYKPGDGITPALETLLAKIMRFTATISAEEDVETVDQKQEWLAMNYDHIPVPFKDTDWERIFSRIEENPDYFVRYYPLFRIDLRQRVVCEAVVALILNDDLYEYAKTLLSNEENRDEK